MSDELGLKDEVISLKMRLVFSFHVGALESEYLVPSVGLWHDVGLAYINAELVISNQ